MRKKIFNLRAATILVLLSLTVSLSPAYATGAASPAPQNQTANKLGVVKGTVVDEEGEPLIGVSVTASDSKAAAVTDLDGNFSFNVKLPTTLTFSYVGFTTQKVKVTSAGTPVNVTMEPSAESLDEVVVVAYGTQKKETMTGSVAAIGQETIQQTAAANLTTALAGRMPGLTTLQTSGMPGVDDVTIYLRGASTTNGQSPLILIDGVPRDDISSLDPNEVQTVSILKDASATAVFGVRGANGVILVTTRRGEAGKAQVSVAANYSMQQFNCRPTRIHSWEFAQLRNEAFLNDGYSEEQLPYTPYMIDMYKSGADPVFFPDRDVYSEYFKKWAPQTRVNVNVNGGNEKVRYFLNIGYLGQSGQLKTENKDKLGYDPGFHSSRFNFRSNLDFNICKNLKMSLNVASYLGKINSPASGGIFGSRAQMVTEAMSYVWFTDPTQVGPTTAEGYTLPDGTVVEPDKILQQTGAPSGRNIYGDLNRRGYMNQTDMRLQSSFIVDWGLDFITKGLSTKLLVAFDSKAYNTRNAQREYDAYGSHTATSADDTNYFTAISVNKNDALTLSKTSYTNYYLNLQYSINYEREFGDHRVTAMALAQRDNWQKYAADLPYNMLGVAARATYAYDSRYLAEVNVGYNGSEQFAKGHRFGFFPAVSLGWLISNESFLRGNTFVTRLKLRGSYGKVGNDNLGSARFLYLDNIVMSSGSSNIGIPSLGNGQYVNQTKIGNPNIGWEIAYKQNYGIYATIFGNRLQIALDYFRENRENILISRSTVPQIQGRPLSSLPKMNMGKVDNSGIEIDAVWNQRINKEFNFSINGNFAYNKNTVRNVDEVQYDETYAYRYRSTGYSLGQCWGYLIDYSNGNGYINTPEELERAKKMYSIGTPRMGDFMYQDVNGDGTINEKDISPIGYSNIPRITYGFGANLKWREFDLSCQFQGVGKVSKVYSGAGVNELGLSGFYTEYHKTAWTAERYANGEEITYPALSTSSSVSHQTNNFFIMDRSFLRLKNLEIGYTLPKKALKAIHLTKVRAYASGTNLLTWHHLRTDCIDPEQTTSNQYPITKMFTFGLNVTF